MKKFLLLFCLCITLTACTNNANKDLNNEVTQTNTAEASPLEPVTKTNTEQVPEDDSNVGAGASIPGDLNEDDSNVDDNLNSESEDTPVSNPNNGDSTSQDDSFDYLTIQETPMPAITKVEGILLVNKSFYLESNYVPENLTKPNIKFSFGTDDETRYQLTYDAAKAIEALFQEAKNNNIELAGVSLYRSYARQKSIYNYNVQNKGIEHTSLYSAKPGFSEHQTGLAIDVSAASSGYDLLDSFGETTEGTWVKENCARFGFIIRFLKGKENITGYAYEPWHLRYVGVDAATYIMEHGITLEEYYALKDR